MPSSVPPPPPPPPPARENRGHQAKPMSKPAKPKHPALEGRAENSATPTHLAPPRHHPPRPRPHLHHPPRAPQPQQEKPYVEQPDLHIRGASARALTPGGPLSLARIARIPGGLELLPSNSPPIPRPADLVPVLAGLAPLLSPLHLTRFFYCWARVERERRGRDLCEWEGRRHLPSLPRDLLVVMVWWSGLLAFSPASAFSVSCCSLQFKLAVRFTARE